MIERSSTSNLKLANDDLLRLITVSGHSDLRMYHTVAFRVRLES